MPIQKYKLVTKPIQETAENEIRVKATGKPFHYAAYAGKLLTDGTHPMVYMLGTGPATSKIIQAVEFLRKRVKGVHICYEIENTVFDDKFEPTEEGLDVVVL